MKFIIPLILIFLLAPFNSCSLGQQQANFNQKETGHFRLYSYPRPLKNEKDGRYKKLVFASLNNFAGHFQSIKEEITNKRFVKQAKVYSGGLKALKAYLDILKLTYKKSILTLDAGSFLPKYYPEEAIFYYNSLGIDIVNLGENEFDLANVFSAEKIQKILKKANFDIVMSNTLQLKGLKFPEWNNTSSGMIKIVNDIKVGVVGVLDPKIAVHIAKEKLAGLYFKNMAKTIIETSNDLKKKGAQVIVALIYSGIDCASAQAKNLKLPEDKVNFLPKAQEVCSITDNELYKVLTKIPKGLVDLVISGGQNPKKVANIINDIPVIQNKGNGQFISWVELFYDTKHKLIDQLRTRVHQPVKTCHSFIKETEDCYLEKDDEDKKLGPASFLGHELKI